MERNRIVDSGDESGIAIDVQGLTSNNRIMANTLRETRGTASRIGIRLADTVGTITLEENAIEGFATSILDLRKS